MKTIFQAVVEGDLDAIRLIREQNQIDINAINSDGNSALNIAIRARNLDAVKLLLEFPGIDLNQETLTVTSRGSLYPSTPLFLSVLLNEPDILKALLTKGADPARQLGDSRVTSLMQAAYKERTECLKLLLAARKEVVHLKTSKGYTVLDILAKEGILSALRILTPHMSSNEIVNAAKMAEQHKHPLIAKLLLKYDIERQSADSQKESSKEKPVQNLKVKQSTSQSTTQDKYDTLKRRVQTLKKILKSQEEVIEALQRELKEIKENSSNIRLVRLIPGSLFLNTAKPAPETLLSAVETSLLAPTIPQPAEILSATNPTQQPTIEREACTPAQLEPNAEMVQAGQGILKLMSTLLSTTPLPAEAEISHTTPGQASFPFFALASRPLRYHNDLSHPANYSLNPNVKL